MQAPNEHERYTVDTPAEMRELMLRWGYAVHLATGADLSGDWFDMTQATDGEWIAYKFAVKEAPYTLVVRLPLAAALSPRVH